MTLRMKDVPEQVFVTEDEWAEYELSRSNLAGTPEHLHCYTCTREAGGDVMDDENGIARRVIRLGRVVEKHRDPTQTYVLECGHTVI